MSSKAYVLNCPVELIAVDEAVNIADLAIKNNLNFQIITINPEMIMNSQKNKAFLKLKTDEDSGSLSHLYKTGAGLLLTSRTPYKAESRATRVHFIKHNRFICTFPASLRYAHLCLSQSAPLLGDTMRL